MCVVPMLLRPEFFRHPHWGLSYFGARRITLLPYYTGFAVVLACLARITYQLRLLHGRWRFVYWAFLVSTVLSAGIAVTTCMVGPFLFWSHILICLALLLWVLGVEIWALRQPGNNWIDYAGFGLVVSGAVIINLSADWMNVLGLYPWGEIVLFVGSFVCLGRAALRAIAAQANSLR